MKMLSIVSKKKMSELTPLGKRVRKARKCLKQIRELVKGFESSHFPAERSLEIQLAAQELDTMFAEFRD